MFRPNSCELNHREVWFCDIVEPLETTKYFFHLFIISLWPNYWIPFVFLLSKRKPFNISNYYVSRAGNPSHELYIMFKIIEVFVKSNEIIYICIYIRMFLNTLLILVGYFLQLMLIQLLMFICTGHIEHRSELGNL